jgi:hypothetical protein
VFSANTDEVLQSLLGLFVSLAPCLNTVDDILGELGVLAVTVGGSVVLAVLGADLEPSVHAGRENICNLRRGVGRRWVAWGGCLSWRRRKGRDTRAHSRRSRALLGRWGHDSRRCLLRDDSRRCLLRDDSAALLAARGRNLSCLVCRRNGAVCVWCQGRECMRLNRGRNHSGRLGGWGSSSRLGRLSRLGCLSSWGSRSRLGDGRLGRLDDRWWRGLVRRRCVAVESNMMKANLALGLRTLEATAKVDVDCLSTTALRVLNGRTVLLARHGLLFAQRAIVHCVVEVDLNVKLNGNVDSCDTETILPLVAAKCSWLLLAALVRDGLVAKSSLREHVALADRVGAFPVLGEIEVAVLEVGVAILEVRPVETALLLVAALVVCVLWRTEWLARQVPCSGRLLSDETREECVGSLHSDCRLAKNNL